MAKLPVLLRGEDEAYDLLRVAALEAANETKIRELEVIKLELKYWRGELDDLSNEDRKALFDQAKDQRREFTQAWNLAVQRAGERAKVVLAKRELEANEN